MHMWLEITQIHQMVSRVQIQTMLHVSESINRMADIAKQMQVEDVAVAAGAPIERNGFGPDESAFHIRIADIEFALKNPRASRKSAESFLTSLKIRAVSLHYFGDQPFGAKLIHKDVMRQQYMDDRQSWLDMLEWGSAVPSLAAEQKRAIRQSTTSATVGSILIETAAAAVGETVAVPGTSAETDPVATASATKVELVRQNYQEYHMPIDTPLVQFDMTSYFRVIRRSTATDYSAASEVPLPTSNLFCRVNPLVIQLNQPALMQLVDFCVSCQLGAASESTGVTSSSFEDLARQLTHPTTLDKLLPFWKKLEQIVPNYQHCQA